MINRYRPLDHEDKIRDKIKNLKQTKGIHEYINEFRILLNQIGKIEEKDKIGSFADGLNEMTKRYVKFSRPPNLEEAILTAENYDCFRQGNEKTDTSNIFFLKNKKYRDVKIRSKANYKTSVSKKIHPNKAKMKNMSKRIIKCYGCGSIGHYKSNCRKNSSKPSSYKIKSDDQVYNINDITKSTDLLKLRAFIHENEVEVVLDTGATISVMSLNTAKRLELKIHKFKIKS